MVKENSSAGIRIACTALFMTGFSGLVYEIVWVQMLGSVFGHTMYSISSVTAIYMAGLALGSWIFGRRVDREREPRRLFLFLQLGISLCSLLILLLIRPLMAVTASLFRAFDPSFYVFSLIKLIFSFVILLPPTLLMGGSFPVVTRMVFTRTDRTGSRIGRLYALNMLGSVAGCMLVGFLFIPKLGLPGSVLVGAVLNAAAGFLIYSRMPTGAPKDIHPAPEKQTAVGRETGSRHATTALAVLAILGFASLAYEVLWARELSIVFFSSTYGFTVILTIFLVGLAAGSFVLSRVRWVEARPWAMLGLLALGVSILGMFSSMLLRILPQQVYLTWIESHGGDWTAEMGLKFLVAFIVLFPPTFLLGGVFPVACRILMKHPAQTGSDVGRAYGMHTAGTIAGSLVAGFVLLPLVGVKIGITAVSLLTLGIAAFILIGWSESKSSILAIPAAFLLLVASWPLVQPSRSFRELPPDQVSVFSKDDVGAEVRVTRDRQGDLRLYINEKKQGGTDVVETETWAGLVPMFIHPEPDSVLIIGLGTGITAGAVARFPVEHIRIVELIRSLKACAPLFAGVNGDILADDRVELVEGDGVNHLMMTEDRYDVILSDIVHPDDAGAGNLYSKEFYRTALLRLRDGGIFAQWIVLDQFSEDALLTFIATFADVFPETSLWLGYEANVHKKCLLIGSRMPQAFEFAALRRRLLEQASGALMQGRGDVFAFLSSYVAGKDVLLEKTTGVALNSIWKPVLEFEIPKHRFVAGKGLDHLEELTGWRTDGGPALRVDGEEEREAVEAILMRYRRARRSMERAELLRLRGYLKNAEMTYEEARSLNVDPIVLAEHYVLLGRDFMNEKRIGDALRVTEAAARIDGSSSGAYRQLGILYGMEQRLEESETAFRIALDLNPEDGMTRRSLGISYALQKKFRDALPLLLASFGSRPTADVAYFIGTIYLELEEDERARHYLRRSLEIDPGHRFRDHAQTILRSGR